MTDENDLELPEGGMSLSMAELYEGGTFPPSGEDCVGHVLTDENDLELPEVGMSLSMAELYEGVTFPPDSDEALTA